MTATIYVETRPIDTVAGVNGIANPSGRRGLSGYTGLNGPLTQNAGSRTLVTADAAGASETTGIKILFGVDVTYPPGKVLTFSADVRSTGCTALLKVVGDIVGGVARSSVAPVSADYLRLSVDVTLVASPLPAISLYILNSSAAVTGNAVIFRDARVGEDSVYFDGSTPDTPGVDYRWVGADDLSTSGKYTRSPSTDPLEATLVLGYDTTRQIRSVAHRLLSSPETPVTLRKAGLRSGRLKYFFDTEVAARRCESMHALANIFTLVDTDRYGTMKYIPVADIRTQLDAETRAHWVVDIGFQEINTTVVTPA